MGLLAGLLLSTPAGGAEPAGGADEGDPDQGTYLKATKNYDETMLKTAISANWHVLTVSERGEAAVKERLEKAGWTLLGGVIEPEGIKDGRAYVALDSRHGNVVVSFRGSGGETWWQTASNAVTDGNALKEKPSWLKKHNSKARVHKGFSNEYARFRGEILKQVEKHADKPIFVVGFSLGGALAQLAALDIKLNTGATRVFVFPHAAPRVGESDFREFFEDTVPRIDRVVLDGDPVPELPPKALKFAHAGRVLLLDLDGHRLDDSARGGTRVRYHNYDTYRDILRKHLDRCATECRQGALDEAADNTR